MLMHFPHYNHAGTKGLEKQAAAALYQCLILTTFLFMVGPHFFITTTFLVPKGK